MRRTPVTSNRAKLQQQLEVERGRVADFKRMYSEAMDNNVRLLAELDDWNSGKVELKSTKMARDQDRGKLSDLRAKVEQQAAVIVDQRALLRDLE